MNLFLSSHSKVYINIYIYYDYTSPLIHTANNNNYGTKKEKNYSIFNIEVPNHHSNTLSFRVLYFWLFCLKHPLYFSPLHFTVERRKKTKHCNIILPIIIHQPSLLPPTPPLSLTIFFILRNIFNSLHPKN